MYTPIIFTFNFNKESSNFTVEQETRIAVMAPLLPGDRKLVAMAALGHSINFQYISIGLAALGAWPSEFWYQT